MSRVMSRGHIRSLQAIKLHWIFFHFWTHHCCRPSDSDCKHSLICNRGYKLVVVRGPRTLNFWPKNFHVTGSWTLNLFNWQYIVEFLFSWSEPWTWKSSGPSTLESKFSIPYTCNLQWREHTLSFHFEIITRLEIYRHWQIWLFYITSVRPFI